MATTAPAPSQEIVVPANMLPVQVTGMQAMASKMWMPLIAMGFMIVLAAFIAYGRWRLSPLPSRET